jgi:hypothetical protein
MELRSARHHWANRDRFAPDRILRVLESDLRRAEVSWADAWDELSWERELHADAKAEINRKQAARP